MKLFITSIFWKLVFQIALMWCIKIQEQSEITPFASIDGSVPSIQIFHWDLNISLNPTYLSGDKNSKTKWAFCLISICSIQIMTTSTSSLSINIVVSWFYSSCKSTSRIPRLNVISTSKRSWLNLEHRNIRRFDYNKSRHYRWRNRSCFLIDMMINWHLKV